MRNRFSLPARVRPTIVPGSVLVLLAGRYRGKRVIYLKQLPSGLLLVTGPLTVNGVPLRRVNQAYVLSTSTVVDVAGLKVPSNVTDAWFKKDHADAPSKSAEDLVRGAKKSGKKTIAPERRQHRRRLTSNCPRRLRRCHC
eukprot:EC800112.1.p2 GENE.EC800112.1~~EC800112.1.p2  ORF type:complete len:140 (+),score=40.91 EC800112.1:250-669(+)